MISAIASRGLSVPSAPYIYGEVINVAKSFIMVLPNTWDEHKDQMIRAFCMNSLQGSACFETEKFGLKTVNFGL